MENVIKNDVWLKTKADIGPYFMEEGTEYFDCGQGYYEDQVRVIVQIGDKEFYDVVLTASIESEKQDRGDRLYFVDQITTVDVIPVALHVLKARKRSELTARIAIADAQLKDLYAEMAKLDE